MQHNHNHRLSGTSQTANTKKILSTIFITGIFLLTACLEKEEFQKTSLFENTFNKEAFSKILPSDFQIDWNSVSKGYSEDLGFPYNEFRIIYKPLTSRGKYKISYTLITPQDNSSEFYVVKFYEEAELKNQAKVVSFSKTDQFSGLIHVLDKTHETVFAKRIKNGEVLDAQLFVEKVDGKISSNARMYVDCTTVAVYHYTDWYVNGVYVDSQLDYITWENDCDYNYLPDLFTEGGGGGGNYFSTTGGGVYNPCSDSRRGCIYKLDDAPTQLVLFSPDRPIADMADYLKCFDITQDATITIYVDQPKANSSDSYVLTWSGAVVGHTFVSITQGGNTKVFGFYPASDDTSPTSPPEASAMGDDSGDPYDVSISTIVSGSTLSQILQYSKDYNNRLYSLNNYNCSDFGIEVGNKAGLSLPDAYGTWPLGGGGSNPGALGQHIRTITPSGNISTNTTGGSAPNNNSGC